jgi:hypothetical protein
VLQDLLDGTLIDTGFQSEQAASLAADVTGHFKTDRLGSLQN